ncbi:conserved hypothetical protein [Coccidioides posadasii str. Silveira]|uniref:Aminoglycoside phosphotransferase domain-containing protein n=1 Tax=Coccidioides posadasii (strain RMSCC 757 / Silveira) TaxID=443226 RepID=E9D354_COCPS|nr:conserved hypothetical protein [Coccidioides posadasii str. Silveira]
MHAFDTDPTHDTATKDGNYHDEPNGLIIPGTAVPAKLQKALLHSFITLSSAERKEEDMRAELQYITKMSCLYDELEGQKEGNPKACHFSLWFAKPRHGAGARNVGTRQQTFGEEAFPGNAEEKVHSKIATYIWISKNCPDIPIPKLQGFGVPSGLSLYYCLHGSKAFSGYIPQHRPVLLRYPYILVDWIEHSDAQMRSNRRIGSWTIDNDGRISLSNRPMYCYLHQLENYVIPSGILWNMTYTSAGSFYLDLLTGYDNRLRHQANAAFEEADARGQAKDLVLMQALLHLFTDRHLHNSPFVMQLADMHAINIFVDEDWNIKHVVDLEWACCLPLGNLLSPFWLNEPVVSILAKWTKC